MFGRETAGLVSRAPCTNPRPVQRTPLRTGVRGYGLNGTVRANARTLARIGCPRKLVFGLPPVVEMLLSKVWGQRGRPASWHAADQGEVLGKALQPPDGGERRRGERV
eukprot:1755796-Prymnesium_polylepis.2